MQEAKAGLPGRTGIATAAIAALCVLFLILNSVIISDEALSELSDHRPTALLMNFLLGCQGRLGEMGSMSFEKVFHAGEWWRLFTHMYLHGGVVHTLINIAALLFSARAVEKKLGVRPFLLVYHGIAILDALILCLLYPGSTSVGASAGIFGLIGILCMMYVKKDPLCSGCMKKGEKIYLIIFSALSLVIGRVGFMTHLTSFLLGCLTWFLLQKQPWLNE